MLTYIDPYIKLQSLIVSFY